MTKVVKVDTRGNFRLPTEIKQAAGISAHDELLVTSSEGSITIRKFEQATVSDRFEALAKKTREKFRASGVSAKDVSAAVQWARSG